MRFPHNDGRCRWCTFRNRVFRRLGLRHKMLPDRVWHGAGGWKWYGGYGRVDENMAFKIEKEAKDVTKLSERMQEYAISGLAYDADMDEFATEVFVLEVCKAQLEGDNQIMARFIREHMASGRHYYDAELKGIVEAALPKTTGTGVRSEEER